MKVSIKKLFLAAFLSFTAFLCGVPLPPTTSFAETSAQTFASIFKIQLLEEGVLTLDHVEYSSENESTKVIFSLGQVTQNMSDAEISSWLRQMVGDILPKLEAHRLEVAQVDLNAQGNVILHIVTDHTAIEPAAAPADFYEKEVAHQSLQKEMSGLVEVTEEGDQLSYNEKGEIVSYTGSAYGLLKKTAIKLYKNMAKRVDTAINNLFGLAPNTTWHFQLQLTEEKQTKEIGEISNS